MATLPPGQARTDEGTKHPPVLRAGAYSGSRMENAFFPSTRWSVVRRAAGGVEGNAREAFSELCGAYWYPLFAFLRRSGRDASDSADLVQGLFVSLLERESLERVGRFDPKRARTRFLSTFTAENTRHIEVAGVRVGFVVVTAKPDHLLLDHFYVHPRNQGAGVGSAVLRQLFAEANDRGTAIRVGALRESDSNRFYMRHGFELVERGEWDNYYQHPVSHGD